METPAALSELERVQTQILQRISDLELRVGGEADISGGTTTRLSSLLLENGVKDFKFKRVTFDYYDWSFETRRDVLGAASIHHLCKSIVLVNTQAPSSITDCSNRNMSKYYVVVVQYTARFSAEAVKNFLYSLNNGKVPKKRFNLRLAPEESSQMLTGYEHNGVTCIGMKTDIPRIQLCRVHRLILWNLKSVKFPRLYLMSPLDQMLIITWQKQQVKELSHNVRNLDLQKKEGKDLDEAVEAGEKDGI